MATKSKKIIKRIGYSLLVIILLFIVAGIIGIRNFNNSWFKDRPNYLTYTAEEKIMTFEWSEETYGEYTEPHVAMLVPVKFKGLSQQFYFQFDTGSPTTFIYENTIASLKNTGIDLQVVSKDTSPYVKQLNLIISGYTTQLKMIEILENYGSTFSANDTISKIKIGTIGTDIMDQRITEIDFKNQKIQYYDERPKWMEVLPDFKPFSFKGRRLMLPAEIKGKNLELFYDSGCSAFGLITSKNRYDNFTEKAAKEITYDGNRFGESLTLHHKDSEESIAIGTVNLMLKRISYIDMYASFQSWMTPFTKIGGWLGNKPFIESAIILDTKKEEFIVIEGSRLKFTHANSGFK